jgi:TetR/AcrR family transcriptional regulator
MAGKPDNSTEQKILEAAELIFHEKGYELARMQEIADKASINKGLLHYYFKSKDSLFDAIFGMALRRMLSNISSILQMEIPLDEKIDLVVDSYMNMLARNSSLPRFVITELNKDPEKFIAKYVNSNMKNVFSGFADSVQKEADSGKIRPVNPKQLFMNIISMIIFPYVGRPMIQVVAGIDNAEFKELMQERRELIKSFIKHSLKP